MVVRRPHDAVDDVAVLARAARVEHLHRHDADAAVSHAGNAACVVSVRRGDARQPRAVAIRICQRIGCRERREPAGHTPL